MIFFLFLNTNIFFQTLFFLGGGVSEFTSFRVYKFQSYQDSESPSFQVSKEGREGGKEGQ